MPGVVRRSFRPGLAGTIALLLGTAALGPGLAAQQGRTRPDSAARDTSAVVLPTVTVTRTAEPINRVPAAIGVLSTDDVRRGQATLGLDEALTNIPGVFVANRYNFSVDQRISIRGAGSRANFGVRGVKVLLDGIPQTLPDGQSQLTNVDFADLERIEVLRGASSSLYGNASGGVLSFFTDMPGAGPFSQVFRVQGGSFGSYKWQSRTMARNEKAAFSLSVSQFKTDGFRQQSAANIINVNAAADVYLSARNTLGIRLMLNSSPESQNPGAITPTEYAGGAGDTLAGPANVIRGADKDVAQQQAGLTWRTAYDNGNEVTATVFGLLRQLENPLATPGRAGLPATSPQGTWVSIDRAVGGARAAGTVRAGRGPNAPKVTGGVDWQLMDDDRRNYLSVGGIRRDSTLVDQNERITELGPFAQASWAPLPRLLLEGGGRYDRVSFTVTDYHLSDGRDNSGERVMSAWSGNVGASYDVSDAFVPYANLSTAFETPTTTELGNRPDGSGGFNPDLSPQRTVNVEVGARGRVGKVSYTLSVFRANVSDAIVQFTADAGRAYFTNAGKTRNQGIEAGVDVTPIRQVRLFASYTYSDFTFTDYKIQRSSTTVDTLDGKRLPAVPEHFLRLGLRTTPVRDVAIDVDHTIQSEIFADDRNTQRIGGEGPDFSTQNPTGRFAPGYGAGVTNLRVSWNGQFGRGIVAPFAGVSNLFDRTYVGSVTINGAFNRVLEPSPRRNFYVGAEVGLAALRR